MKRNGNKLNVIPDGHPRRMADGKNAWRKMNEEQRIRFVSWLLDAEAREGTGPSLVWYLPANTTMETLSKSGGAK